MYFTRILIPTDFSPASKTAFELAAYAKKMEGSEIILLHINPIPDAYLMSAADIGIPVFLEDQINASKELAENK